MDTPYAPRLLVCLHVVLALFSFVAAVISVECDTRRSARTQRLLYDAFVPPSARQPMTDLSDYTAFWASLFAGCNNSGPSDAVLKRVHIGWSAVTPMNMSVIIERLDGGSKVVFYPCRNPSKTTQEIVERWNDTLNAVASFTPRDEYTDVTDWPLDSFPWMTKTS